MYIAVVWLPSNWSAWAMQKGLKLGQTFEQQFGLLLLWSVIYYWASPSFWIGMPCYYSEFNEYLVLIYELLDLSTSNVIFILDLVVSIGLGLEQLINTACLWRQIHTVHRIGIQVCMCVCFFTHTHTHICRGEAGSGLCYFSLKNSLQVSDQKKTRLHTSSWLTEKTFSGGACQILFLHFLLLVICCIYIWCNEK